MLPLGSTTAPRPSRTADGRRRTALLRRGRRLLRDADELLDPGSPSSEEPDADLARVAAQLDVVSASVVERLTEGDRGSGALGTLLVELQSFRSDVHEHERGERRDRLDALEAGLAPLRFIHDPQELLSRVCEALVTGCGFDRALLSRVEDSTWRPWKSYAAGDREFEQRFREWLITTPRIPLDHLLLENEMVRRRAPAIVLTPDDPRVYRPLAEASGLVSYVAAPLMPTGRVIGFLHADHETAPVTEIDREVLWAFTESFGHIFERAVLLNRLREQREQVGRAMATVTSVLSDLANAEIELAGRAPDAPATLPGTGLQPPSSHLPGSRIEALLTARELEVLGLMATGATNARIAQQLVISDATVKSHVKRILRKLRAGNRAEAISRYLRLTMGGDEAS
ncbi:LuxR C-terminal-related transcriptional regulator [Patulibacter sp. NPDC049589]|uniref:LuxR C-terminal-related transcriptional regulator n=1 Tax=Patulibacter sp. NPDC049589 TaxID=3154731 RepID=UPI00342AF738